MKNRNQAFNLFELFLVISLIVVLAALFLPALAASKRRASRINCVNCLKQISLAFKIWAEDKGDKYPMAVSVTNGGAMEFAESGIAYPIFQVMSNEVNTPKILICPDDAKHFAATNFTTDFNNNKISYFIGSNATEDNPQAILAGDDNLLIDGKPVKSGNLFLSTNRVIEWSSERSGNGHGSGNIALADGSVQQTTSRQLNTAISVTSAATNRLIIP